ncbi:hypothetical protein BOX15_Mlig015655g2, partial [Macrostomum lignano]
CVSESVGAEALHLFVFVVCSSFQRVVQRSKGRTYRKFALFILSLLSAIIMSKNYIVTAQRSTAVSCSLTGHFTGNNYRNLLVAKHNTLELHVVSSSGVKTIKEISIYGKISVLLGFQPQGRTSGTDLIFLLTQKKDAMILECQVDNAGSLAMEATEAAGDYLADNSHCLKVVTLASGNLHERIGRQSENGPLGIVDPRGRVVALQLYEGLLKVIPVSFVQKPYNPEAGSDTLKAFNVRIEEIDLVDMTFIDGVNPTIAYITQDSVGRHLKTVEINCDTRDLAPGPWKIDSIQAQASMLIPLPMPHPGLLIVGQETVTIRSKDGSLKTIAPPVIRTSPMLAFDRLDCNRFLLGDMAGRLFMLFLEREGDRVKDMKVELLGEISIPETISYLDNNVVFIGSRFGDSQLIRLLVEADSSGNFVSVLESFVNIAPVVDMAVVDIDNLGQGQLVTCSGAFKDGSLRIIRSGVGINEMVNIDLAGIKGVWNLRTAGSSFDNFIIITFQNQTKTLLMSCSPCDPAMEIEEVPMPAFETAERTYLCQNVLGGQIVQVTPQSARLLDSTGKRRLAEWLPPSGRTVSVCGAGQRHLLIAIGRQLTCLAIGEGTLTVLAERELPNEVACIDATPLPDGFDDGGGIVAVGLWVEISVRLLRLRNLEEVCVEPLGVQIIPRSIVLATMPCGVYLFVGIGDGTMVYFTVVPGPALVNRKHVIIGTQPMGLCWLPSQSLFVCTDRPAIAHCVSGKLVISHVNTRQVNYVCPILLSAASIDAQQPQQCICLVTNSQLLFGTIDDMQKLHIRTVPLGESARKVAHQPESGTLAVVTSRVDLRHEGGYAPARTSVSVTAPIQLTPDGAATAAGKRHHAHASGMVGAAATVASAAAAAAVAAASSAEVDEELEVTSVVVLEQNSLQPLCSMQFPSNPSCVETATSITSGQFGTDCATYFVVGTCYIRPNESEPSAGRLLMLQYTADSPYLTKVAEKEIRGAPYSMCCFNQRLLVCVNSSVRLFEWSENERELRLECSHFNNIIALYLKTKGDFALVGDLLRSMSLLLYKPVETSLEEIVRDHAPNWMLAIEIIDDDAFLGAENCGNLFVCSRESENSGGEERPRLQENAWYHLGDTVNTFQHGSLVMSQLGERLVTVSTPILFATQSGAVGLICQLPPPLFEFLNELQRRLASLIVGVGGVEHAKYRSFETEHRTEPAKDFIDGDLLEAALDLGRDKLETVAQGLTRKTDFSSAVSDSVPCTVEDLIRILEELSRLH